MAKNNIDMNSFEQIWESYILSCSVYPQECLKRSRYSNIILKNLFCYIVNSLKINDVSQLLINIETVTIDGVDTKRSLLLQSFTACAVVAEFPPNACR